MQEGDVRAPNPDPGVLVDQAYTGRLELGERRVDVRHAVGDVMQPGAPAREVLAHGRLWTERREELDVSVPDIQQSRVNPLVGDRLPMHQRHPKHVPVVGDRGLDVIDSHAHVIDRRKHGVAAYQRPFAIQEAVRAAEHGEDAPQGDWKCSKIFTMRPPLRGLLVGRLDDLEAMLVALDGDLRRISSVLESPFTANVPFPAALLQLTAAFTDRTGIVSEVRLDGDLGALGDVQRVTLLSLIREALSNIRERREPSAVHAVTTGHADT